jgi:hypothetical protein
MKPKAADHVRRPCPMVHFWSFGTAKQVVFVQDRVDDIGMLFQASAYRGRNRLPTFSAKPRTFGKPDVQAAHCAYFATARGDAERNAQLLLHALRNMSQVRKRVDIFNARNELFLFFPGQAQYAKIGAWLVQQTLAFADTCAGRTFIADRKRKRLQHGLALIGFSFSGMILRRFAQNCISNVYIFLQSRLRPTRFCTALFIQSIGLFYMNQPDIPWSSHPPQSSCTDHIVSVCTSQRLQIHSKSTRRRNRRCLISRC